MDAEEHKRFTPSELLFYKHALEYRYMYCVYTLYIHCIYIVYTIAFCTYMVHTLYITQNIVHTLYIHCTYYCMDELVKRLFGGEANAGVAFQIGQLRCRPGHAMGILSILLPFN